MLGSYQADEVGTSVLGRSSRIDGNGDENEERGDEHEERKGDK